MKYGDMRQELLDLGYSSADATNLTVLAGLGYGFTECFAKHGEEAANAREFLEAVYNDDNLRMTKLWATWAQVSKKQWVSRFEPLRVQRRLFFSGLGPVLEFENGAAFLVASGTYGKCIDIMEFEDNTVNDEAGKRFTSVQGKFKVGDMEFDGTYDIIQAPGTLIFEKWVFNLMGDRAKTAALQAKTRRFS